MKCWNETCMLTDLPIHKDENIGAVLLVKKHDMGKTCYPNDIWEPISPIMYGTYDGYGMITNIESKIQQHIMETFRFAEQNDRAKFVTCQDDFSEKQFDTVIEADTALNDILSMAKDECLYIQMHEFSDTLEPNTYSVSIVFLKRDFIERCANLKDSTIVRDHIHQLQQNIRDKVNKLSEMENALQDNESKTLIRRLRIAITDSESTRIGIFFPHNSMIACFMQTPHIEEVFQIQTMLSKLRRSWMPPSCDDSQNGIEDKEIVEWYKRVLFYITNDYTSKSNS